METRSGRRPGTPQTREAILDAAMRAFAEDGYAGTTIRGVARVAGVDPALVMHFFGSKDGLFEAAIRAGEIPLGLLVEAFEGDPGGLGERLVSRYVALWEDQVHGPRLRAVMSAAASSPAAAAMLKEFVTQKVLLPMTRRLGVERADTRGILAGAQLIGVAFARYVLEIEPLAKLGRDELVRCVAPAIQRYLTGDLPLDGGI
ncbi:TetR family transcriptional regulator [Microbispora corallina]|uniref:TetR family transcriptional regulator n=1 Tax=Microbispora corallina TaxID=83302 RepID=A0ABQ4FVE0_9ACTN|nr:TetR family transcriptional regulator [Microbispora corallina]GIH38732.1 TetR family transcriptional regulator [Microbispora corallina]